MLRPAQIESGDRRYLLMATVLAAAVLTCAVLAPLAALAQNYKPEYNPLYDDTRVATVRITIDPALLDSILAPGNEESDFEHPASFSYDDGTIYEEVDNIGFRLRGNTSRFAEKRSFKVSFNTYVQGGDFMDVEKLNLNGEHNDPSIIRSKLAWDLFQTHGVAASRAAHVRLYINDVYYGLYANVEHIDEQFLQSRYGYDGGTLYKCLYPADLSWLGPSADDYRPTDASRRPYDLKLRDSDEEGYDDLAHFIDVLNNAPTPLFADEIEKVFDVNGFLRILAVDIVTGSWDDYWYLKNNFYLYNNPRSGLFEFIPYDYDNTFGIWWDGIEGGVDWATRDIYQWGNQSEPRPLTDRILAVPAYVDRLSYFVGRILDNGFVPGPMKDNVDRLHALVTEAAEEDVFRTLDYGFTVQDFHDSFTQALGGHVTYGLKPFIDARHASAQSQVETPIVRPVILDAHYGPVAPSSAQPVFFYATVLDDQPGVQAELEYTINDASATLALRDDGTGGDEVAGDNVFTGVLPPTEATVDVTYRFVGVEASGRRSYSNKRTTRVGYTGTPLYINELMASNDTTVADPFGDNDDWVELYNGGSEPINLGGLYFTDNLSNPDKWAAPDTSIAPGAFVVLWLDEEPEQGPLHVSFKLSAGGEQFGIFDSDMDIVDAVTFGEQETDVSFGRTLDGAGRFDFLAFASPAASNATNTAVSGPGHDADEPAARFDLYPNPFRRVLRVRAMTGRAEVVRMEVHDVIGRLVYASDFAPSSLVETLWEAVDLYGNPVAAGTYFVRLLDARGSSVVSKTVVRLR